MVHLFLHGYSCCLWAHFHHTVYAVPPYSSHRHLLLPVCSQNLTKTSAGGQKPEGEEEESGGERKDSQKRESSGADRGGNTRAEQEDRRRKGGKGGESREKRPKGKRREVQCEEESLHHHCHYPGSAYTQLRPLHHHLAYEWTSASSNTEVSVYGHGSSCCGLLYLSAASALPAKTAQAAMYDATKHLAQLLHH